MPADTGTRPNPLPALLPELVAAHARLDAPPAWLSRMRSDALAALQGLQLPDEHTEAWRYTSLPALRERANLAAPAGVDSASPVPPPTWLNAHWLNANAPDAGSMTASMLTAERAPRLRRATFSNGKLTHIDADQTIGFALATRKVPDHFAKLAPLQDGFVALNGALMHDVLCIDVPPGHDGGSVLLQHCTAAALQGQVAPRVCIRLQRHAQLTLIEDLSPSGGLHNLIAEIELAPGAQLRHWRATRGGNGVSVARTYVRVQRGAHYQGYQQLEGGLRVREELQIELAEEGAQASLAGVGHVLGRDHADLSLRVVHGASHTRSSSQYRGIAGGRGRFVFRGQIHIPEGVRGIDAALTNKNILLSNDAEIDTRPELTINADDVRCSHGATVGQLDGDALFLMRARGIDEALARALIKRAFAMAALFALPEDAVRGYLQERLQTLLESVS